MLLYEFNNMSIEGQTPDNPFDLSMLESPHFLKSIGSTEEGTKSIIATLQRKYVLRRGRVKNIGTFPDGTTSKTIEDQVDYRVFALLLTCY